MDVRVLVETARGVGFHLRDMELLDVKGDVVRLRVATTDALQNVGGVVHGGAVVTFIDDAGSVAIIVADAEGRNGVSTDINVTQVGPAPVGCVLIAEARALKVGRRLAFAAVDVRREDSGELIAQGRLTKAL